MASSESLIPATPSFAQRSAWWKTEAVCCALRLEEKALLVCGFLVHLLQEASIIPSAIPRLFSFISFPEFLLM